MASEYTSEWCIVEGNLVTLTNDGKSSKSKMNTEPLFVECEGKQGEDALRVEGHELKVSGTASYLPSCTDVLATLCILSIDIKSYVRMCA